MKFLADENFPKPIVGKIRSLGFSIKTIQQKNLRGSSDETVAKIALKEKRIILTFDKDFLIKNRKKLIKAVVFEFSRTPTEQIIILIENFLKDLEKYIAAKDLVLRFNKKGLKKI